MFSFAGVPPFKKEFVSETILRRLLSQDVIHHVKCKGKDRDDPSTVIFQQGQPVDFFVLILEGRVEVMVGRENLMFESGPFTYFGSQALAQNMGGGADSSSSPQLQQQPLQQQQLPPPASLATQPQIMGSLQSLNLDAKLKTTFVPDYTVRAVAETVYIAIKRNLYLAAKRATLMERSNRDEPIPGIIDEEVEMLLHSLDDDHNSGAADGLSQTLATPKLSSKQTSGAPSPTIQVRDY